MRRTFWSLLIGIIVLIGGIFLGIAGLLLFPIIGVFALMAILFWLAERKAEHSPPAE